MDLSLPPQDPPADVAALLPGDCTSSLATACAVAWAQAPFLKGLMRSRAALLGRLSARGPDAVLAEVLARARGGGADIMTRLRQARGDVALLVGLADLAGLWPLERVTGALSDFADLAIDAAIAAALAERGGPKRGLVAFGLGKLGSRELNYSSDVDLILLHEPELIPRRAHEEPEEAAVRIGRRAVAILADLTPDGMVARVDLRLRPAPEVTPMVLPVAAAEHYYQSQAETWERLAWVRARPVGGDMALGAAFAATMQPFVWRRSMDFTAVRDVQSVSLSIRDHFETGEVPAPGFDLKRGRGGIREVEFFTQIHQLLWGGREPALRVPATLDALAALARAGLVPAAEAAQLAAAWRLLRGVEHRLQMRRDEQTHAIPKLAADRAALAALCGAADWPRLEAALRRHTGAVAAAYDRLIAAAAPARPQLPADVAAWLRARRNPPSARLARALAAHVARWRAGQFRALRSDAARAALEQVLPALLDALLAAVDPLRAAARLERFLEALPPAAQFLGLLAANPPLLALVGQLLGVAPVLADALARAPALIDVMLGPEAVAPLPGPRALAGELDRLLTGASSFEEVLDRVRRFTAEWRFLLGARLIEGRAAPLEVSRLLAALADAALWALAPRVTAELAAQHGEVPGAQPLVLAMGRYGGGSLTHASDLDLVFLFESAAGAVSDGAKPLPAAVWFNRWAQRLTSALSVPTAEGGLYEVDTRLRPWGAKGMLAVSLESFGRYQAEEAETWEHMALTRARLVTGGDVGARLEAIIAGVLDRPRPLAAVRAAARAMRAEIAAAKPAQGALDVKLGPGGLVDLEFVVHALQLTHPGTATPDMAAALDRLAAAGALDREEAAALKASLATLTAWLVALRLVAPASLEALPAAAEPAVARALGAADYPAALEELALARARVRLAWERHIMAREGERT